MGKILTASHLTIVSAEIDRCDDALTGCDPGTDKYHEMVADRDKLQDIRDKEVKTLTGVASAIVAGLTAIGGLILKYRHDTRAYRVDTRILELEGDEDSEVMIRPSWRQMRWTRNGL